MIPGPTPLSDDVRAALAEPVRSHSSAENAAAMRRVAEVIRLCVGSASARVHVFGGAGTLAMEAAVVNHAAPGDRVVICAQGAFGDRFAAICRAHGMEVDMVAAPWGERVDPLALRAACAEGRRPALVTVTHVDTSTGVLADAAALAAAVRDERTVLVLDGVCATGGVPEAMDEWGYDVVLAGAQKALAVPPGLAILAVSDRARERRASLGRINAFYADLANWEGTFSEPQQYFSTHSTTLIRALEASCEAIVAEGLPARFARHERVAAAVRAGFTRLGFEPMTDPQAMAATLTVLATPPGVDPAQLQRGMADAGVVVAGCLGQFAGRGIRVGHMGTVGDAEVERTLAAATSALA